MEITYLQYLLIKNGYGVIKRFDTEEAIRQVEEERLKTQVNSANPLYKKYRFSNFSLHPVLYVDIDTDNDDLLIQ